MKILSFSRYAGCLAALVMAVLVNSVCGAETSQPVPRTVGLFDAMKDGLIEVKVQTTNSLDAKITAKNISDVPLVVSLPKTFAAVPLQQFDGGYGTGGGSRRSDRGGNNDNNNENQSTGGGFNNSSGTGGSGMWSLAPEKIVRENVKTVCLEHGKREPRRTQAYELKPLESVTDKPEVIKLCELVGNGAVDQDAAQAAVWHYNNGMSWEELANKTIQRPGSRRSFYFNRQQMMTAVSLGQNVEAAIAQEKQQKQKTTRAPSAADM